MHTCQEDGQHLCLWFRDVSDELHIEKWSNLFLDLGVSKNGKTPKMDGLYWKTLLKWDDLGIPLFLETPVCKI